MPDISFDPISAGLNLAKDLIDRFVPDKTKAAELKAQADAAAAANDMQKLDMVKQLALAQIDVNKTEATSQSLLIAGWRPAVGWIGAASLALVYWPKAIMLTVIWTSQCVAMMNHTQDFAHHVLPAFPDLGVTDLIGLLGSLLGFGTMRSWDKNSGTSNGH